MANHTRNRWSQDTPNTDGQLVVGIGKWAFLNTTPAPADASFGDGIPYYSLSTAATYGCLAELSSLIRTGMLATSNLDQQQFGTAALQPGPSSVANTSDPLGVRNFPPFKNSANPIYGGVSNIAGAVSKGFQVNWVDIIYAVAGAALTAANFGLAAVNYTNTNNANVQNIITYGANGLPTATTPSLQKPYVTRINVASPAFYTLTDSFINASLLFTTGAGGSAYFYGCVFGVSFNLN